MAMEKQQPEQAPATPDAQLPKKLTDLLATVTEKDLRAPERDVETLKGNTVTASVWVHSPATFKFSALANRRLTKVARLAGMGDAQVLRIHARLVGTSNTVLIRAADPLDTTAFEVAYYPGAAGGVANLYGLLGPARCTVQTGYRQKYDVHLVPQSSPLWPGLLVDLDEPREKKLEPVKKKKNGQSST